MFIRSTLLLLVCTVQGYGQQLENKVGNDFSRWSFSIQPSFHYGATVSNSEMPSIRFNRDFSYQGGVAYKLARYHNFNFKTGLFFKLVPLTFDIEIEEDQLGFGRDSAESLTQFDLEHQFYISPQLKTEYYIPLTSKVNLLLERH